MPRASETRLQQDGHSIRCAAQYPSGMRKTLQPCGQTLAIRNIVESDGASMVCKRCKTQHTLLEMIVADCNGNTNMAEALIRRIRPRVLLDRLQQVAIHVYPRIDDCAGYSSIPPAWMEKNLWWFWRHDLVPINLCGHWCFVGSTPDYVHLPMIPGILERTAARLRIKAELVTTLLDLVEYRKILDCCNLVLEGNASEGTWTRERRTYWIGHPDKHDYPRLLVQQGEVLTRVITSDTSAHCLFIIRPPRTLA